jgi:dephospho-CoA kinase
VRTIGLTGGIGMGKSTAADLLAREGLAVIDTDVIARDLVEFGQPALAEIAAAFGSDVLDATGHLDREKMAERIFASSPDRQKLEAILHPRILEQWKTRLERHRVEGHAAAAVVIPLLFETGAAAQFDATICVACSAGTQRSRLLARGWTPAHLEQRIQAQWPTEKKMHLADFVVWTEGSMETHRDQLQRVMKTAGAAQPP